MTAVLVKIGSVIKHVLRSCEVDLFQGPALEPRPKDICDFRPAVPREFLELADGVALFDPFPKPDPLSQSLVIGFFPDIGSPAPLATEPPLALPRVAEALNLDGPTVRTVLFFES